MNVTIDGFDSGVMLRLHPEGPAEETLLEAMAGNGGTCEAREDDGSLIITVEVSND